MSHPLAPGSHLRPAPQFYITPRHRFSRGSVLLAIVLALACLVAVGYAVTHTGHGRASAGDDDDDDPSRVDTIYLGGPHEAPSPNRPGAHASAVHPFVVVQLPRSGDQVGQIPDTAAGRLLYAWLAAFNGSDFSAINKALPTPEMDATEAAQFELRKQTGGFTLLSAREVRPGLLVFRLHDQTPSATEVLGTLQVSPTAIPPGIASFSLRAVPQPPAKLPGAT